MDIEHTLAAFVDTVTKALGLTDRESYRHIEQYWHPTESVFLRYLLPRNKGEAPFPGKVEIASAHPGAWTLHISVNHNGTFHTEGTGVTEPDFWYVVNMFIKVQQHVNS